MRGALIGFGAVAENAHAPAWKALPDFEIAAIAEASASRREAAQKHFPKAKVYSSPEEMLKKERRIDFVDIATPPHMHAAQIGAALKAGRHVICEKPLVLHRKDLTPLKAAAKRRDKVLFTVHNWKYAPLFQKLRELLDRGTIGAVHHAEWHVLRTKPAAVAGVNDGNWRTDRKRSGGGILIDHGWHAFYLLHWLLDGPHESVRAALKPSAGRTTDEEATCLLRYPKASAVVHLSWNAPRRDHWGVFYGRKGAIELQDDRLIVRRGDQPPQSYVFPEALSRGSAHPEWFQTALGEFREAVEHPAARQRNLKEAADCIAIIERIYRPSRVKAAARV